MKPECVEFFYFLRNLTSMSMPMHSNEGFTFVLYMILIYFDFLEPSCYHAFKFELKSLYSCMVISILRSSRFNHI